MKEDITNIQPNLTIHMLKNLIINLITEKNYTIKDMDILKQRYINKFQMSLEDIVKNHVTNMGDVKVMVIKEVQNLALYIQLIIINILSLDNILKFHMKKELKLIKLILYFITKQHIEKKIYLNKYFIYFKYNYIYT